MLIHNVATVEDLLNDDALMEDIGFPEEVVAFLHDVRRHSAIGLDNTLRAMEGESFDEMFATAKTDPLPEKDPNKIEILIPRKKR
jgi:hypothetical protein